MKFEISETINTKANQTDVLNSLTLQFRVVSKSVLELTNVLQIKQIESSFGSALRNDLTIVSIQEKSEGCLLIAQVNYKTSLWFWICFVIGLFTYIGWAVPIIFYFYQKNMVKDAVQNVFLRVKNEFQEAGFGAKNVTNAINNDALEQLEKLHLLKEKGIITEEEFNSQKKVLLKN